MSAGTTTERVLTSLRRLLVSRGFKPGDRLEPALLAQRLETSGTPIREALHMLTGEGLVESRVGGGFNLPFLDAAGLHDRYAWSEQVLTIAVRTWPRRRRDELPTAPAAQGHTIAERCGAIFLHIARQSTNGEHARAVSRLNTRLHHVRLVESDVLPGLEDELAQMTDALHNESRKTILKFLAIYHHRRQKMVHDIVLSTYHTS